jgi:SAM-dependent methyltransferase
MGARAGVFDPRLLEHRQRWEAKKTLRLIYEDYYRRLFSACPPTGAVVDIGGGSAHSKDFRPESITLDILPFPGIDVVADAHRLPFGSSQLAGIVMLDVLHHLNQPTAFLGEAARVLKPGGKLAMIEPAITPVSWWFYNSLHHEPVALRADPFRMATPRADKDPFDGNQAIPSLIFGRKKGLSRLAQVVPQLSVTSVEWLSLAVYPMSGGFKRWCLVPSCAVRRGLAIEDRVPAVIRRLMAFRLFAVLERE